MAESDKQSVAPTPNPKKKSRIPIILGTVGAILFGGTGYYLTNSKIFKIWATEENQPSAGYAAIAMSSVENTAFVALEQMIISLGKDQSSRHLIFSASIETEPTYVAEITNLIPRFSDVLNTYLRAVSVDELESPAALFKLRSHMLRRLQMVAGNGKINDLLISEFVID